MKQSKWAVALSSQPIRGFFNNSLAELLVSFKKLKLKNFYKLVIPFTLFSAPVQTMFDHVCELR